MPLKVKVMPADLQTAQGTVVNRALFEKALNKYCGKELTVSLNDLSESKKDVSLILKLNLNFLINI